MNLPSNFNTLFERFSNELDNLDLELLRAIELVRERIALFPDNIASVQLFATLSNYALFAENTRRRIQETLQYLRISENLSEQAIQEIGEDLSEQLGRLLEAKIVVGNIRIRLEK
jgi:excinuclease UvrABC helicase subunit UvrB